MINSKTIEPCSGEPDKDRLLAAFRRESVDFHDINFWAGENNLSMKYSVAEDKLPDILEQRLKNYGITATTITHFNSFYHYPSCGNEMLSGLLKELNERQYESNKKKSERSGGANHEKICRFFGAMLLEHESIYNPEKFEKILARRYKQGFRLVRLFPKSHKYPYSYRLLENIYRVLDSYHFPVMISLDEIDITGDKCIEWEKLIEIADNFKNMPLIIDGGSAKELMFNNYFFVLLKNSSSIFLNTHNLFGANQIEDLSSASGPHRLVFDSNFPFYDPSISVERVLGAGLPEDSKRMIASGSIEKIYSGIGLKK
ncbi:MAG: hypothetical protein FJW66_07835 [Actinobacteria bacterium]|nr:hypothetical protein [Actinomycetota bacterium]